MCRLAARAGAEAPLSRLLYDLPRSLHELAVEPRQQLSGRINVDGTAVAWFAEDDPAPLSYRSDLPPWSDPNLPGLAPRLRSRITLAAVRSTTAGIPQGAAFVHPFTAGPLAGTHNGYISDFRTTTARTLMAELSDEAFSQLTGMSDSNVLFLLAVDAHRAGATLLEAAREAVARTQAVVAAGGTTATLTLVLADAGGIAAVNGASGRPANSLHIRSGDAEHLLASEPLDDDPTAWTAVPPGAAVEMTPTTMELLTS